MTIHVPAQPTCVASALDQFFTRPEIAKACYGRLVELYPVQTGDLWIEPSAGAGAFLELMPKTSIGLDLVPAADGVTYADYLDWTPPSGFQRHVVVGNPPFGQNASKAIAVFNRAAEHADVIAMILPRSVRKPSLRRRLDAMFHLVDEILLPSGSFLYEGKPASARAVFHIWERRDHPRVEAPVRTSHPDFDFCDAAEAEFSIRRVGGVAGRIFDDSAHRSPSSHLFVKAADGVSAERLRDRFAQLDFSEVREDSVAHYSVAKSDVFALYEALVAAAGQASPSVDRNAIGPKDAPREDRQEGLTNKAGCQQPREAQRLEPKGQSISKKSSSDFPQQNIGQTISETSSGAQSPSKTSAVHRSENTSSSGKPMDKKQKRSDFLSAPLKILRLGFCRNASTISGSAMLIFDLPTGPVCTTATLDFDERKSLVMVNEVRDTKNNRLEFFRDEICAAVSDRLHEIAKLAREVDMLRP